MLEDDIAQARCPGCDTRRSLQIEWRSELVLKEPGDYSIAGAQLKFSATEREWPWVVCTACGIEAKAKGDES